MRHGSPSCNHEQERKLSAKQRSLRVFPRGCKRLLADMSAVNLCFPSSEHTGHCCQDDSAGEGKNKCVVKVTAGTPLPGIPDLQSKDFASLFSEATANPAEFALLRPENMAVIFRADGESDHKLAWDTGARLPRTERELTF